MLTVSFMMYLCFDISPSPWPFFTNLSSFNISGTLYELLRADSHAMVRKGEDDVDGYIDIIKRVCFGKQLKPKALCTSTNGIHFLQKTNI